jgi:hypothetical protein
MVRCSKSLFFPIVLAGSLTACTSNSSFGLLSDYVGLYSTNVTTSCGGGYQVFRKKDEPKILVRAYEIPEIYKAMCEARQGDSTAITVTGVRHEEAAIEYISQTADLKECKVAGGAEITRLHSEFALACPIAPATVISVKG